MHSVDNMDTATEYVHSFVSSVSSLFGAEPAPEPLPWYLEWWVFFGFYVSRIIWQVPLVPKVQASPHTAGAGCGPTTHRPPPATPPPHASLALHTHCTVQ